MGFSDRNTYRSLSHFCTTRVLALVLVLSVFSLHGQVNCAFAQGEGEEEEPSLEIISPEDGEVLLSKILRLRGRIKAAEPIKMVLDLLYEDGSSHRKEIKVYGEDFDVYGVLNSGRNELIVKAIDGNGTRLRDAVTVEYKPPASALRKEEKELFLLSPKEDAVISSPILKVEGRAKGFEDSSVVYIQVKSASGVKSKRVILRDGTFSAYFVLNSRENTLDLRCGEVLHTIDFQCSAPKGHKASAEEGADDPSSDDDGPRAAQGEGRGEGAEPAETAAAADGGEASPRPSPAAPVKEKAPDIRIIHPRADSIVDSPIVKVQGVLGIEKVAQVIVELLEQGAAEGEVKVAEVEDRRFSKYFVLKSPFPIIRTRAIGREGNALAENLLEFRCAKPKGWTGPLPWEFSSPDEDDPSASSGAPPVAAPVNSGDGRDETGTESEVGQQGNKGDEESGDVTWKIVLVPIVLFIMLPVIIVRGSAIVSQLSKKVGTVQKTRNEPCQFCQAMGKRYFLFDLPTEGEGREVIDGMVACAGMTSNDEVNRELRPLLEKAHSLETQAGEKSEGERVDLACLWCKECKSGFLVVKDGEEEKRYPLLAPVYFDWLLVSCGLH